MHGPRNAESGGRRRRGRLTLLALVGLAASSCAPGAGYRSSAGPTQVYPPAVFAHRVATPDVEIYWNCSHPEPDLLRVDGVARNTGGREVRFLELQLVGVSAEERNILQAATAIPDIVLYTNRVSPFRLDSRTMGREVRYDLYYRYGMGVRLSTQDIQFMARDVCSETQHRVSNTGE